MTTRPEWWPPGIKDQEAEYIAERLDILRIADKALRELDFTEGIYPADVIEAAKFLSGDTN